MKSPALLGLEESRSRPSEVVGAVSRDLLQLKKNGLPIPRIAILPQTTLEKITQETQLGRQLKTTLERLGLPEQEAELSQAQKSQFLQQVKQTVRHLRVPAKISREIIDWYQQKPGFYRVAAADEERRNDQEQQNVIGEANLLDSILTIWAQYLELDLSQQKLKLFAPPILLQFQGQPEVSGVAFTEAPEHKANLLLHSVWGVHQLHDSRLEPDQFHYDLRTKQIIRTQLQPQVLRLQRASDKLVQKTVLHYQQQKLSLTKQGAKKLAQLIATIKRLTFTKHLIRWFYKDGQFYITEIEPLTTNQLAQLNQTRQVLVQGQTLLPGIVAGEVLVATNQAQVKKLKAGQVLVIPELKPEHRTVFKKVSAIICDRGLTSPLLKEQLKKQALPTILNTKHATRQLETGQKVLVDANAGQVIKSNPATQDQTTTLTNQTPTITKVYISAGNPAKAQEYVTPLVDGVGVLRSEYVMARLGTHPLHLIRSSKKKQLQQELKTAIQTFQDAKLNLPVIYRSQNFTSQELSQLNHAESYEEDSPNPYLGFRGGLQLLRRFELLDLEARVITQVLNENPSPLGLMLPFVRTASEARLIIKQLKQKYQLFQKPHFSLYLQLNTPANVWQLDSYFALNETNYLAGVSLDARSLHALSHGIDPHNPELFSLYPYNLDLMRQALEQILKVTRAATSPIHHQAQHPTVILQLEDHHLSLVELATELGVNAVTVKPSFVKRVKTRIQELEAEKLKSN